MRIEELIKKLPTDTKTRVKGARDRFNPYLRRAMRTESALLLRDQENDVSIPIRVEVAFPKNLERVDLPGNDWRAFTLAPWRPLLEQLRDSTRGAMEHVLPALLEDKRSNDGYSTIQEPIEKVYAFAEELLQILTRFDLVKRLYEVHDHILGCYDSQSCEIYLYWGVIGLISRQLGVSVEDLAVVVLAHELGHAYTHQGADIEGHRWPTGLFINSSPELVEGLAQYFTLQICRRVASHCPGGEQAYYALLKHQPEQYHEQEKWANHRAEEIRLALLRCRRSGQAASAAQFKSLLDEAQHELGRISDNGQTRLFSGSLG